MNRSRLREMSRCFCVRVALCVVTLCANQLTAHDELKKAKQPLTTDRHATAENKAAASQAGIADGVGSAPNATHFREHVAPILQQRCLSCHNDEQREGAFSLQTANGAFADGHIDAGDSEASHLLEVLTPVDGKAQMPKDAGPLSPTEIAAIRKWIDQGAHWAPDLKLTAAKVPKLNWWSLRPLRRPAVPAENEGRVRTPIDAFLKATLREKGLTPAPEADRLTLARRLFFDLLGLPPTPEELAAFVHDTHPKAYERLVDRLLQSHHYGERWARHWLDVAHYADTHGYDKDKLRPHAWPYRDYVIRSLNADKPYSQFVMEQIAGDVLWPETHDGITATGFIAAGPWDYIGHAEVPESKIDGRIARNLDRDDMVTSTMNSFCSTTVQCARCHDHKFDPLTQEHYYSLQAVFAALDRADRPYDENPQTARLRNKLQQRQAKLATEKKDLDAAIEQAAGQRLTVIDAGLAKLQKQTAAAGRAKPDMDLARLQEERTALLENVLSIELKAKMGANSAALQATVEAIQALPPPGKVYAGTIHHGSGAFLGTGAKGGQPRPIHVLHRGNILEPRKLVGPGTIPILAAADWRFDLPELHKEGDRRVALASWLVRRDNPLTWRSIVNRVWQYHFGRGIVDSPNDFGRMGKQPSHPELLDWLAVEFRDGGQSLKMLHKLILTSSVYRQASAHDERNSRLDTENVYLWRMNRRRLAAEEVRDAVLSVSGKLERSMYGPGFQLFVLERPQHSPHYEYHKHDPDDPASHRRSIYRFIVRSQPDPFMTTLDCADSSQSVAKRDESITALQALSLLNNKFVLRMAEHFADRLKSESNDTAGQVELAFQLATGRRPTTEQQQTLFTYADEFGLDNMCRLLFNLNDFVFVD